MNLREQALRNWNTLKTQLQPNYLTNSEKEFLELLADKLLDFSQLQTPAFDHNTRRLRATLRDLETIKEEVWQKFIALNRTAAEDTVVNHLHNTYLGYSEALETCRTLVEALPGSNSGNEPPPTVEDI